MNHLRRIENGYFYLLFCTALALSWYFHKDATRFSDRHELWSDRAGYYIYLPATFFYQFNTHKMPADLDVQTGGGFSIDTTRNKIDTKYTYGVALMESPFFLASVVISGIAGYDSENGFSMIYMRMMALAAVVYLMFGLWFLKKFLDHYFNPGISMMVITALFLGTNLFYYSLIDGMMSHVYSFFLCALFLYGLKEFFVTRRFRSFLLITLVLALLVLIRPTNLLLALLFFGWDAGTPAGWRNRVKLLLQPKYGITFLAVLFLVFLPQLVYWKYLSGNWIHFSYAGEGFTNWRHPKIAGVLFSPVNGLFTGAPLLLFPLAGMFMMILQKKPNGWLIAGIFAVVTLVCASWKMWYFGCSLGQRSYIEYYPLFAVPLAWLLNMLFRNRFFMLKTGILFLLFLLVYANLRYTVTLYRFDRCYYGSTWDWEFYKRSFERAGVISPVSRITSFENDFENLALCPVSKPSMIFTRSGQYSIAANGQDGMTLLNSVRLADFGYPSPKTMEVSAWFLKPGESATGASLNYQVIRGNEVIFRDAQPLDSFLTGPGRWFEVNKAFILPDVDDSSLVVNLSLQTPRQSNVYADDLLIRYKYRWH